MIKELRTIMMMLGMLITFNAILMVIPIIIAGFSGRSIAVFLSICIFGLTLGGLMILIWFSSRPFLGVRGIYILIPLAYVIASIFSGFPYIFGPPHLSFIDALFESISGFSTTGATVMVKLEQLPSEVLVWRSMTEWIGGIGVLFLAVLLIPILNIGGQQLLRIDRSEGVEKSIPRTLAIFINTLIIYSLLSLVCFASYKIFGMSNYDAFNHALTTVSTGGFSTYDASFAAFSFNGIEYVAMLFMIVCSLPLPLLVLLLNGRVQPLVTDQQVRFFLFIIAFFIAVFFLAFWQTFGTEGMSDFSHILFNVISIITGTGYVSQDYNLWGESSIFLFLIIMLIGGCSGSTTGGLKIFRLRIVISMFRYYLGKLLNPLSVAQIRYNGRIVTDSIVTLVMVYCITYLFILSVLALLFLFSGLDFLTAISAAASAVGNVGPGLGDQIGPVGNYSGFAEFPKLLMIIGMLLGRIEIFPLIILLSRTLWRE